MPDISLWELRVRDMTIADLAERARVPYSRVHAEVRGGLCKGLTTSEAARLRAVLDSTPRTLQTA
jgi:plasmid maintenance system antidote protein VapI